MNNQSKGRKRQKIANIQPYSLSSNISNNVGNTLMTRRRNTIVNGNNIPPPANVVEKNKEYNTDLDSTVNWFNSLIITSISANTELRQNKDECSKRLEYLDNLASDLKQKPIDIEKSDKANL